LSFTSEYDTRKVEENRVGLKLNGIYRLLLYAVDVNMLGDNIDAIKKITNSLIDAGKEVGLEIRAETSKCMLLSCHQNAGQNYGIQIAKISFKNVAEFKYLGTIVTIQN
jgi:hypothetical protein